MSKKVICPKCGKPTKFIIEDTVFVKRTFKTDLSIDNNILDKPEKDEMEKNDEEFIEHDKSWIDSKIECAQCGAKWDNKKELESAVAIASASEEERLGLELHALMFNKSFESSSIVTPQFNEFYKKFTAKLGKALKDSGCTNVEFHKMHFELSGFFTTPKAQIYYVSIMDVRCFNKSQMLIRTAQNYKDYTGGCNHYIEFNKDFTANLMEYIRGE